MINMAFISPSFDVLAFSFFIILVINIFYKILVNQADAKQSKDRMKEINDQMKQEQKKGNTEKVNKLLSELMQENSRLMKMSLKPMIVSFVIILLALPWISDIYGDKTVKLNDNKGELKIDDKVYVIQKTDNGIEIDGVAYQLPQNGVELNGAKWNIELSGNEVKFSRVVVYLPFSLPFVGNDLGWLGWYFVTAILFMIVTRKFLKIYL